MQEWNLMNVVSKGTEARGTLWFLSTPVVSRQYSSLQNGWKWNTHPYSFDMPKRVMLWLKRTQNFKNPQLQNLCFPKPYHIFLALTIMQSRNVNRHHNLTCIIGDILRLPSILSEQARRDGLKKKKNELFLESRDRRLLTVWICKVL